MGEVKRRALTLEPRNSWIRFQSVFLNVPKKGLGLVTAKWDNWPKVDLFQQRYCKKFFIHKYNLYSKIKEVGHTKNELLSQKYPLCFVSVRAFNNSTHSVNDGHLDALSSISLFVTFKVLNDFWKSNIMK